MTLDEDLNIEYTDINEANRQIKLLINEKDVILESILNSTCENCKHGVDDDLGIYCPFVNYYGTDYMDKDFGCLKFERKEL